jgi:type IV pilus assembly protein PilZ
MINIQDPPSFHLDFADKISLYNAYMPYLKAGGIFVATAVQGEYYLEQMVQISLTLPNGQGFQVAAYVVWISPSSQVNRVAGLGVEFVESQETQNLNQMIEEILGQALHSNRATHIL